VRRRNIGLPAYPVSKSTQANSDLPIPYAARANTVQAAPYSCARELLGVLTSHPGAVDVARLGLERLLYHAIARACDLQKVYYMIIIYNSHGEVWASENLHCHPATFC
jgi:hypothetical protein